MKKHLFILGNSKKIIIPRKGAKAQSLKLFLASLRLCVRNFWIALMILCGLILMPWQATTKSLAQSAGEAQNGNLVITTYGKYEGLLAKDIMHFVQDSAGYIYAATNQGIWKYNGSQFYQFLSKRDGLAANKVYRLFIDSQQAMWVSTSAGLHKINDGQVTDTFSPNDLVFNSYEDTTQRSIWYVDTAKQQLIKINGNKIVKIYSANDGLTNPFSLLKDHTEQMWVGTANGLVKFNDGQIERLFTKEDGLRNSNIHLLFEARGYIWVSDIDGGLSRIRDDKVVAVVEPLGGYLEAALADEAGNIWLGSASGLIRYRPDDSSHKPQIYTIADGLADNYIMSLFEDRDGNIWVGTANGISKIAKKPLMLPFAGFKVYSQMTDKVGQVWLGTADGLRVLSHDRIVSTYRVADGLGSDNIKAILEDKFGLWIGTTNGLSQMETVRATDIVKTHTTKDGLPSNAVWSLAFDKQHRLWVGTDNGLAIIEHAQVVQTLSGIKDPAAKTWIMAMARDKQGNMFVGGRGQGLNLLRSDGTFVRQYTEADGFKGKIIKSIVLDNQANLWVVSEGGVYHIIDEKVVESYTNNEATILDSPRSIVVGRDDTVWVGLDGFGLSSIVAGKFKKNYSYADGLINSTIYSLGKDYAGNITIGTGGGLVKFDPTPFQVDVKIDRLTMPQIDAQGQMYELLAVPSATGLYQFSHDQQTIRFRYASSDFRVEGKRFQTILEGYDQFWRDMGPLTERTYMNLPAGDYTFKVKVQNFDGSWNPHEASVKITVLPPFWKTWWFYGLTAVLIMGLSLVIFRLRVRAMQARNRQLEAQVAERTKELNQAKEEIETALHEMQGLFEAAQSILGANNLPDICQNFINHFNRIVQADQMVLYLLDHRQRKVLLHIGLYLSYDELAAGISGLVFKSKQPILSHHADDGIEPEATRARRKREGDPHLAVVPLVTKGQVIGTITIVNAKEKRCFTQHDIDFLMTLATQAAAAIENLQLMKEERQHMEQELETARQIQLSLLPPSAPEIMGLDLVGFSSPARQVGGDFYGYFFFDPSHLGVVAGDVSGKGLKAAMMMALSVGLFSHEVQKEIAPNILLSVLNTKLHSHTRRNHMNTALGYIDLKRVDQQWTLRIANAGLITPLIRYANGAMQWVDVSGLPLGMMPDIEYGELQQPLASGEVVLLSSDGLVEAMNGAGEMYGFARLTERLATAPHGQAKEILKWILADVQVFVGKAEQHDDMTLVIIVAK